MVILRRFAPVSAFSGNVFGLYCLSADSRARYGTYHEVSAAAPQRDMPPISPDRPAFQAKNGKNFRNPLTDSPLCSIIKLYPYRKQKNENGEGTHGAKYWRAPCSSEKAQACGV